MLTKLKKKIEQRQQKNDEIIGDIINQDNQQTAVKDMSKEDTPKEDLKQKEEEEVIAVMEEDDVKVNSSEPE